MEKTTDIHTAYSVSKIKWNVLSRCKKTVCTKPHYLLTVTQNVPFFSRHTVYYTRLCRIFLVKKV